MRRGGILYSVPSCHRRGRGGEPSLTLQRSWHILHELAYLAISGPRLRAFWLWFFLERERPRQSLARLRNGEMRMPSAKIELVAQRRAGTAGRVAPRRLRLLPPRAFADPSRQIDTVRPSALSL